MKDTAEYAAIEKFYGQRCAKRSGVRLMNHIDEGLVVLEELGATFATQRAFCLHPLFQADEELTSVGLTFAADSKDAWPVMLAMEYRQQANAHLSDNLHTLPTAGPLFGVYQMLVADKVQNKKDFMLYHYGKHARSVELLAYFDRWLAALNISEGEYLGLVRKISDAALPANVEGQPRKE